MENKRNLPMSTYEITKMYKEAADKREQIVILSELNDCTVEEIRRELVKGGIPFQTLPRSKRSKEQNGKKSFKLAPERADALPQAEPSFERADVPKAESAPVPKNAVEEIPDAVYRAVEAKISLLDELKEKHEQALQRVYAELAELEEFMAKRKSGKPSANELTAGE